MSSLTTNSKAIYEQSSDYISQSQDVLNDQISSVDMDSIWWYAPTEESTASDMNGVFKSCPKPELQQDFNMTSFLGHWYQLYMDEGGDGHECTTTDISVKDDGKQTVGIILFDISTL